MSPDPPTLSLLLNDSDPDRVKKLLPLIYNQLRAAAQQHLASERPNHTLSATALVHEAYLKLCGPREIPWQNRAHFYAAAAESMRQVLLDHAKARGRLKRGGNRPGPVSLNLDAGAALPDSSDQWPSDFVALDDAMCRLEARDPRAAQVVRLRYYAGLSVEEAALALAVSERTVTNDWSFARAWLARELKQREVP